MLPELLRHKAAGDALRAWVVDCATGEEAYSIAMVLGEAAARFGARAEIQVFASETDIRELAIARGGRYPKAIARDVSPERLARWFVETADCYCISRELRDTCIFSAHDVTKDMPFSRMDLICGRRAFENVGPDLQEGAVLLFSFSLRSGGFLIASPDAGADHHPKLFERASHQAGIFRRRSGPERILPVIPLTAAGGITRAMTILETEDRGSGYVRRIETELRSTKEELRRTHAQLAFANKDLQRSDRGFRSIHEELQFSREELRSTNKELETVNGELSYRIGELAKANSDLKNFLDSADLATIFLDRELRMRKFTAAAASTFGLTRSDLGRPLGALALSGTYEGLRRDVCGVLNSIGRVERQFRDSTDRRFLARIIPYRGADNHVAGVVLTFLDITAAARAEEALRQSEERFRIMAMTVPAVLFTADARLAWNYVNPRFYEFTGLRDGAALGDGWLAAVHPEDRAPLRRLLDRTRGSGADLEHELRLRDSAVGYRWYLARATATQGADGAAVKWAGSLIDIHERRAAEARQRLLFAELQHRVKNVFGVVRSIAGSTVETSSSLQEFSTHFEGRLNALARTQTSLARHGSDGLDLEELIAEELLSHAPGSADHVRISGPSVRVGERAAEALGLAVHELATNAVKYGAFASVSGGVSVAWDLHGRGDDQVLRLEWIERTVPVIDPQPKRVGFGREFLERGLPFELGATTSIEFRPGGLRFALEVALGSIGSPDAVRG